MFSTIAGGIYHNDILTSSLAIWKRIIKGKVVEKPEALIGIRIQ